MGRKQMSKVWLNYFLAVNQTYSVNTPYAFSGKGSWAFSTVSSMTFILNVKDNQLQKNNLKQHLFQCCVRTHLKCWDPFSL